MICYLVRHGKDDETVRGGWSETMLCEEGVAQVKDLAKYIDHCNIGYIYSSDLMRTKQTADILNENLNVEICDLPQFREVNNGVLAGMKNDVALVQYPGLFWSTLDWEEAYPEGESPKQFFERVCKAWFEFKKEIAGLPYDVVLVTHGGVINVIQCVEHGVDYTNKRNQFPVVYAHMVLIEIKEEESF